MNTKEMWSWYWPRYSDMIHQRIILTQVQWYDTLQNNTDPGTVIWYTTEQYWPRYGDMIHYRTILTQVQWYDTPENNTDPGIGATWWPGFHRKPWGRRFLHPASRTLLCSSAHTHKKLLQVRHILLCSSASQTLLCSSESQTYTTVFFCKLDIPSCGLLQVRHTLLCYYASQTYPPVFFCKWDIHSCVLLQVRHTFLCSSVSQTYTPVFFCKKTSVRQTYAPLF